MLASPNNEWSHNLRWTSCKGVVHQKRNIWLIITARKRSLGQGNIFTSVCQEFCSQGGCLLPGDLVWRCVPPPGGVPHLGGCLLLGGASSRGCLLWGGQGACSQGGVPAPEEGASLGVSPPGGASSGDGRLRAPRGVPAPGGCLLWWGGLVPGGLQAHTQGGNWRGSGPGPHPRGKLRGIRSRPIPKGEMEGDQVQPPPPHSYCCGRNASYWNALLFYFLISSQTFLLSN